MTLNFAQRTAPWTIADELRALLRLATPLVAAHAGYQLMSLVDSAMVGRLGDAALAGVGIGNSIFVALTLAGAGCVFGMDALVTQAVGAGRETDARRILFQGLRVAAITSLPLTIALALAPMGLAWAGVDEATAANTRYFLWARLPNLGGFLVFAAYRSYLQAHGRTRPIVIATIIANLVNVVGNAVLVFGDGAFRALGLPGLGLPALGVTGSGLATSLAAVAALAVLIFAAAALPVRREIGDRRAAPGVVMKIFRLGLPIGFQLFAEIGILAIIGIFAGRLGANAAAGHQVALTLEAMTFTVTLGIANATMVRVGWAVGQRREPRAVRGAGFTGLVFAAVFMAACAVVFLVAPAGIAPLITNDPAIIATAVPLLMIAGAFQLFDGAQVVAAGALRGAGDSRTPFLATLIGHYAVGLPAAAYLAFGAGLGTIGLWWGMCAGLASVALILVPRFAWLSSRPVDPA